MVGLIIYDEYEFIAPTEVEITNFYEPLSDLKKRAILLHNISQQVVLGEKGKSCFKVRISAELRTEERKIDFYINIHSKKWLDDNKYTQSFIIEQLDQYEGIRLFALDERDFNTIVAIHDTIAKHNSLVDKVEDSYNIKQIITPFL